MTKPREIDRRIDDFERAWQRGDRPRIAEFAGGNAGVAGDGQPLDRKLLLELICVDLEYRWKSGPAESPASHPGVGFSSHPPSLQDYIREFSILGPFDALPIEVAAEEYRARQLWGDAPEHSTFLARFEARRELIREALVRVDDELRLERDDESPSIEAAIHSSSPDDTLGTAPLRYSDYLLQRQIGYGAVGKVYQALHKRTARNVAIKYLKKAFSRDTGTIERFVAEARIVSGLNHPGIVSVHGLGTTPSGGYFIVMELASGGDLAHHMCQSTMPIIDALACVIQACDAIEHAHARGVIHCDLKPGNLLLAGDGQVLVTDFGLACDISDSFPDRSRIAGTAGYMAPEQISQYWGIISPQTDVYGLGAVLYGLLCGRPPFVGSRTVDVLSQAVSGAPPRCVDELRPDTPRLLTRICNRCLAKRPAERYTTAAEVRAALQELLPSA